MTPNQHDTSNQEPDTARVYERAKPEKENGMGRLDQEPTPEDRNEDRAGQAVTNRQDPKKSINADDEPGRPEDTSNRPVSRQPDHSMHDEEPLGWDQAPQGATDPKAKRHPRTEGKGGVE